VVSDMGIQTRNMWVTYGNMAFDFLNSKHVLKWGERKCANLDG
jgi:hypothetical protein